MHFENTCIRTCSRPFTISLHHPVPISSKSSLQQKRTNPEITCIQNKCITELVKVRSKTTASITARNDLQPVSIPFQTTQVKLSRWILTRTLFSISPPHMIGHPFSALQEYPTANQTIFDLVFNCILHPLLPLQKQHIWSVVHWILQMTNMWAGSGICEQEAQSPEFEPEPYPVGLTRFSRNIRSLSERLRSVVGTLIKAESYWSVLTRTVLIYVQPSLLRMREGN